MGRRDRWDGEEGQVGGGGGTGGTGRREGDGRMRWGGGKGYGRRDRWDGDENSLSLVYILGILARDEVVRKYYCTAQTLQG